MPTTVERLMVEVRADVRQALAQLDAVERRTTSMGRRVGGVARSMGVAFGGAAIVGGLTKTIGMAKNFDLTIRQVGTASDVTGAKLGSLSDLALKMGQDTIYSAQESADAMLALVKGGLTPAQIKAGALEQALTLAAAGGLDLASAAEAITQGMGAYGLKAEQAAQITTALAGGANASTADVSDLTQALSQASSGARDAGMSIQETVAALAAFDNAGVKGSDAGTSLKTMLARLVPTTDKAKNAMRKYNLEFVKSNGQFVSMANLAGQLEDGLGGLGDAERAAALEAIFGADARRAASILMRQGTDGVRKYIKAANDEAKAQQMANTAMEGASGAWENFTGSVESAATTLGMKALPAVTDLLNMGSDLVADVQTWGPTIDKSFGWIIDGAKAAKPALNLVLDVVEALGGAWAGLPGPVQSTVVQVGLAALAFPRLAAAATSAQAKVVGTFTSMSARARQFGAEMTYAETRTQRLGAAARNVAGVAGMAALAGSMGKAETATGDFLTVAGGALTGFAVGGPIGGAIGGFTSLLGMYVTSSDKAAESTGAFSAKALDLKGSLDQVTGAATRATRELITQDLQSQGLLGSAQRLGIASRDVVSAVLGEAGARKRLTAAIQENRNKGGALATDQQIAMSDAAVNLAGYLGVATDKYREQRDAVREAARANQTWKEALKGIPKEVRTKVTALGTKASASQVADLRKKYDLTPKEVRTVIKALGLGKTTAEVKKFAADVAKASKDTNRDLGKVGETKPNMRPFRGALKGELDGAKRDAANGAKGIATGLATGTATARPNLDPFASAFNARLGTLQSTSRAGGNSIGSALGQGVVSGIGAYVGDAVGAAANLVAQAVAAAKRQGRIKSPSRVMRDQVGKELARGVEKGMSDRRKHLMEKGRDLVRAVLAGVKAGGGRELDRALKTVREALRKRLDGKAENQALNRIQANNKRLEGLYRKRKEVAERYAKAQEALERAKETRSTFRDNVQGVLAGQANVLNAGNNAGTIRASLEAQVTKAREFAGLLGTLQSMGYSRDIVAQVAEAGIEGGLEVARALAAASSGDQAAINSAFGEIRSLAQGTADTMASSLYDAGVQTAQGVVDGLKARQREIADAIKSVADRIADTIRDAFGLGGGGKGKGKGDGKGRRGAMGIRAADTFAATPATAAAAGATVASQITFQFVTHNPVAEPQSQTTNKALARVATLGLV